MEPRKPDPKPIVAAVGDKATEYRLLYTKPDGTQWFGDKVYVHIRNALIGRDYQRRHVSRADHKEFTVEAVEVSITVSSILAIE